MKKIKNILSIKEKSTSVESKQILMADFLKRRYGVTMIQALKTVLPVKQSVKNVVQKHILRGKSLEELQEYYSTIKGRMSPGHAALGVVFRDQNSSDDSGWSEKSKVNSEGMA